MNEIIVQVNPYGKVNEFIINGAQISSYSDLNNFVTIPFLEWAHRLFPTLQNELNDSFAVTVRGEGFEVAMLQSLGKNFSFCSAVRKGSFPIDFDYRTRVEDYVNLAMLCGADIPQKKAFLEILVEPSVDEEALQKTFDGYAGFSSFYGGGTFSTPLLEIKCPITKEKKRYQDRLLVAADMQGARDLLYRYGFHVLVFVLDGTEGAEWMDGTYFWHMKPSMFCINLEAYLAHFFVIPEFISCLQSIQIDSSLLSPEEREQLELVDKVAPVLHAREVPVLEVGEKHKIQMEILPEWASMPRILAKVDNDTVSSVNGLILIPKEKGRTKVSLYTLGNVIPFQTFELQVDSHSYAVSLEIVAQTLEMGENHSQRLGIRAVPPDADDLATCRWVSSNPEVAMVSQEGEVFAKGAGITEIRLEGNRAQDSIWIHVKSQLKYLALDQTSVELFMGDDAPVSLITTPDREDCYDISCRWTTSDKEVAVVREEDDGQIRIQSTGIGACSLTCTSVDGGLKAVCQVKVESSFYREENKHLYLVTGAICSVLGLLFSMMGAGFGGFFGVSGAIMSLLAARQDEKDKASGCVFAAIGALSLLMLLH